jgi:hypothetical protein
VSLIHDIRAALPGFRLEAEGRMVDACTITRAGAGDTTFDPNTGTYTDAADSTIYTGPCEVQIQDGLNAREAEAGGTELLVSRVTVKIPVAVEGVRAGDVVTVTASELDPDLVGQEFRVLSGFAKSFATSRRLQVERVT